MLRFAVVLVALLLCLPAYAQAPAELAHQGYLEQDGEPVDGTRTLRFGLYAAPAGGDPLWSETHHGVAVTGGVYAVVLGAETPFPSEEFDEPRWLEVAVGASILLPRTKLTAAPYAMGLVAPVEVVTNAEGAALQVETTSASGQALSGLASATGGHAYGGRFESTSTDGRGVYGLASAGTGFTYGVYGETSSVRGIGTLGVATTPSGLTAGVWGQSVSSEGRGVQGYTSSSSGATYGVYGQSSSSSGRGVYGFASATSGTNYGVWGQSNSPDGYGVYGLAAASSGTTYGVYGEATSASGYGVYGEGRIGVRGLGTFTGVAGYVPGTTGFITGVSGTSASSDGRGVVAFASATSGITLGLLARTDSPSGRAIQADATAGAWAGFFLGDVQVIGTIVKAGGSFEIDHPLDPENRVLRHSFVESPDMMNVYNGNVTTDARGYATVTLPDWFEALNRDFRYQLTTIGSFSRAMIAEEIQGNRFVIQTEEPGVRVSWQMTGIRQDAWANENRIVVEEDKKPEHRGRYLNPEAFGLPRERSVEYDPEEERWFEAERERMEEHARPAAPERRDIER